jgi:hypothetical protein
MSQITIIEHNIETGEVVEREATATESEAQKTLEINNLEIEAEMAEKEKARKALLERLGITEQEAKLLIG